ncbi:MAG: FAD-dependent oxidoreductase, partial [Lachnospiraceae bacterium]|nr:FAD-dependent oxidoreductase [Lachnospiraceae bacterium]
EHKRTAVNGMSYSGRDGANSNSAMIVTVSPEDYGGDGPLSGIAFQRRLEERAYEIGRGAVPVERYGDFHSAVCGADCSFGLLQGRLATRYPDFTPAVRGAWLSAPVHGILPDFLNRALAEGIDLIGQKVPGFNDADAFLSGVESRTSSPVRILRDETGQSAVRGLFPCGEGAGYAGGITSAAMDGILIAEKVASAYCNVLKCPRKQ